VSAAAGSPPRRGAWRALAAAQRRFPLLQLVLLVVAFVVGVVTLPGFGGGLSVVSVLVIAALAGLASIGQTITILVGGFDLSVAGFIVAGALLVTQVSEQLGIGFWGAFLILVPGALVLGGLVGYLSHRFRIQPLILTLAMGSFALGIVRGPSGLAVVGQAPTWLTGLSSPISTTFGLPVPPIIVIWVLVTIALAVFLRFTVGGRRLYLTGANPVAAEYALVRTRRVWVIAFAFSALCSALAGVMLVSFSGNVDPNLGNPYLFISLAAVIVGGTTGGGPGDYTRTVVGALLLTMVTTVLVGHGLTSADQQIMYGAVILLAMAIYGRERRIRDRV